MERNWLTFDPLPDLLPFTLFIILDRVVLKSICKLFIVLVLICLACKRSVRPQLDESQSRVEQTVNQLSPKLSGIHLWLAASSRLLSAACLALKSTKPWQDIQNVIQYKSLRLCSLFFNSTTFKKLRKDNSSVLYTLVSTLQPSYPMVSCQARAHWLQLQHKSLKMSHKYIIDNSLVSWNSWVL